jgi:hypothetical protein
MSLVWVKKEVDTPPLSHVRVNEEEDALPSSLKKERQG